MVSAAGVDTFTPDQVARLRAVADVAFVRRTAPVGAPELGRLLDRAAVAGLTPRSVPCLGPRAIAHLPSSLRGIVVFATGVDFLDVASLARRGIALANLPCYSAFSVAEHTVGLLLTMSRRIHLSRDRVMGRVPPSTSVRGWELCGRTLGVVGLGRIGGRVARLAQALGMRVVACDPRRRHRTRVAWRGLGELLEVADAVTLHVPSSWGGGPLLDEARIGRMRRHAVLVNASRAHLVDEAAVVRALAADRLGGYAVDDRVTDRAGAADLIVQGRIVETGHTAWYSDETLERGVETWVRNVVSLIGRTPDLVQPSPPTLQPTTAG